MVRVNRLIRSPIEAVLALWLSFATFLSLPYLIASILPISIYYWLKGACSSLVVLLKDFAAVFMKFSS